MIFVAKLVGLVIAAAFGGIIAQADFSRTINLGAIMVAALIVIVAGFFSLRNNLATSQIEGWKGNFEAEKERSSLLADELKEALNQLKQAMVTISEQRLVIEKMEALPNLERVIKLMSDTAERQSEYGAGLAEQAVGTFVQLMEDHEARAVERHRALMDSIKSKRP